MIGLPIHSNLKKKDIVYCSRIIKKFYENRIKITTDVKFGKKFTNL